ncbi:MAG: LamG-like jellyroll fold domain-containing protein, partial [Cyclobacteriaceae bacterium]
MKKVLLVFLLITCFQYARAQDPSIIHLGFVGPTNPGEVAERVYGGALGDSIQLPLAIPGEGTGSIKTGFAYDITYFPNVFGSDLFASKGYFSDYVELQWDVISQLDNISRIKIFRKPLALSEADSTLITTLSGDAASYRDDFIEFGVIYKYTVFAEGIADDLIIPFVNVVEGNGFALPEGTASGRITYEGGTAVEGVNVIAETEGELQGRSMYFNGTDASLSIPHQQDHEELELSDGFTLQLWARTDGFTGTKELFNKGTDYGLSYDQNTLTFKVGDATLTLPFTNPVDSFFQVTATYDPGDSLNLYATTTQDTIFAKKIAAGSTPAANFENIRLGGDATANYFMGHIDEVRLWDKPLKHGEFEQDIYRFIATKRDNLVAYWRLNAGVGDEFYDATESLAGFNENHGLLLNTTWSTITPLRSQLAYKGLTDENGNYTIQGFPYEANGSTYRFVPIFGVHEFDPSEQLRVIGPGSSVQNSIDFTDVSSFPVSGVVRYFNTTFPVEGVSILVDGQPSIDAEGQLITTDVNGQFTVDVPIGEHILRMNKTSHTFVGGGRFEFDFQNPVNGLEFVDSTLVRVAGRVVGGPVEEAKPVGFGRSVNNIGNGTIVFESESAKGNLVILTGATVELQTGEEFIESTESRDITLAEDYFEAQNAYKIRQLTVSADVESGDYLALLPPERYIIQSVTADGSPNPPGASEVLDLRNFIQQEEIVEDTVRKQVGGEDVLGQWNAAAYDTYTLDTFTEGDTTFTVALDTFYYNTQRDFILRVTPTISVFQRDREDGLFGDDEFEYVDDNQPSNNATVPLVSTGVYTFGHPIFTQRSEYNIDMELFEQYTNQQTGATTQVPVVDGEFRISNEFAANTSQVSVGVNSRGKATYSFTAGFPNRNEETDMSNNFTKTLTITAFSGKNGAIQTPWQLGDPFRGIVLGGEPIGNDFVTTGPTEVIAILRDPPGSQSRASLTQGQSISKSTSFGSSNTLGVSNNFKLQMGLDITTFVGLGAGVINSTSITNDLDIGFEAEESFTSERESSRTYTTTQTWSTSMSPDFVGSEGDVFVGHATNLVYGRSLFLEPILSTDCSSPCSVQEQNGFKLGIKEGLRINPEFSTSFLFTQDHIENTLIPNLIDLRNSFIATGVDPNTVNPTIDPVYVSLIPSDDERFGSNNHDRDVWGDEAATTNSERLDGPSYAVRLPSGVSFASDTIFYYNQQIKEWRFWLAENEKQKVFAELSENISFDGGSSFESSTTTTITETNTREFEWVVNSSLASTIGTDALGLGFLNTLSMTVGGTDTQGSSATEETTTTYAYTLNDGDAGDSYTVDIKTPSDGFGPVFSVKAGVTSCPFQDQELTEYYQPGQHVLHEATVNTEDPALSFENNLVFGVPDNREAEFTMVLQNNAGNEADALFDLKLDNSTNPDGAVITIDGAPIGNGRTFSVEAGVSLQLTMKVAKGASEVFTYEDIRLVLESRCEPDVFFDDATFSVVFQPSCTDIEMTSPTDNWVINSNSNPANVLPIHMGNYDLNDVNFNNVRFQYRGLGSASWITQRTFYASEDDFNDAVTAGQGDNSEWIDGRTQIVYSWEMEVPDREYELRAVSVCVLGPGSEILTPTDAVLGIKDTKRPQLFGSPQPADGILSLNDEISIQFDEDIVAAALTPFNFSVQGVLNGRELTNGTSIDFDGVNDYARVQNASSMSSSFTVEFWVQRDAISAEGTLFSKGSLASDLIEIGFNSSNQMTVEFAGQVITSQAMPVNDNAWHHYGISYDASAKELSAYQDGEFVIDKATVTAAYSGQGSVYLAKPAVGSGASFDGALHEFRIWNSYRQQGEIAANRFVALKGTEVNLIGYWPFDEGDGDLSIDLARSKQAEIEGGWRIQPQGYAAPLDGVDDYLEIDAAQTIIIQNTKDFTIELWFKGVPDQGAATLFSSGRGDGTDLPTQNDPNKSLSFGFTDAGALYVSSNGQTLSVSGAAEDYLDDDWHHIAVGLKRKGNLSIYVDGELLANESANSYGGVSGVNMWIGARGTKTGVTTTAIDRYFQGSIDEFRVWELSRTIDQLDADRNRRIEGDEMGLVAYYPFESYEVNQGVPILTQTFEDQLINIQPDGITNLTGGTPAINGGISLNQETANIGLPRPVSDVDFDWVVNGDQIIITPNPTQADLIENVILDITVANVEDERGNLLASPATWTAFVDRNTMKWSEDNLELTKKFLEPLAFEVELINRGGSNEAFTISNLPPWLTANPSSGSIAPAST